MYVITTSMVIDPSLAGRGCGDGGRGVGWGKKQNGTWAGFGFIGSQQQLLGGAVHVVALIP
jgi:hypothetical protein